MTAVATSPDHGALLFVYGTLRRGSGHPMQRALSRNASWLGPATCAGRLYRVAAYPGVVPADDAGDVVHGEVYRLSRPRATLRRLDAYEECFFDRPTDGAYRRERVRVRLAAGARVVAWIYLFNGPVVESMRIASGDFLDAPKVARSPRRRMSR